MNFNGSFSFAAEYVIEVSSLFARQGHVADGDRSKVEELFFIGAANEEKKSVRKGRYDRPLMLTEDASKLLKQKRREEILNYRRGKKIMRWRDMHRSSHISSPIAPLVPDLAACFCSRRLFEKTVTG